MRNFDDEKKNETYKARYNVAFDCFTDNIDRWLDSALYRKGKEFKAARFYDFLESHICLVSFVVVTVCVSLFFVIMLGVVSVNHNLEIDALYKKANVCKETGYGCESNTNNRDIKYDNTPIIDVDAK